MRSRLEAGFAAWLDRQQLEWKYEPDCYADEEYGQWLPDFAVEIETDIGASIQGFRTVLIDVKPSIFLDNRPSAVAEIQRWLGIMVHQPDPPGWPYAAIDGVPAGLVQGWGSDDFTIDPWLTRSAGIMDGRGFVGLGSSLEREHTPWYGQWWKG